MSDRQQEIEVLGLPINITRWICNVAVDDTAAARSKHQAMFVRDQVAPIVVRPKQHDWQADPKGTPDRLDNYVHAVSVHWSKSVLLEVRRPAQSNSLRARRVDDSRDRSV